ncbi:MAG: hypothetical protein L6V93_11395 [Clostridiales bacterium]|nr:MAG: hypothetical protein L6V93_11395 [Clostridiales bacterium]
MIKVCIISCGMIANSAHIPAYRTFGDDFFISAVSDINENSARETAKTSRHTEFLRKRRGNAGKRKTRPCFGVRPELFS